MLKIINKKSNSNTESILSMRNPSITTIQIVTITHLLTHTQIFTITQLLTLTQIVPSFLASRKFDYIVLWLYVYGDSLR